MRFRVSACVMEVCLSAVPGSLAEAAAISVPPVGDLQAAIDQAQPGDVIALAPGATYVGNFVLKNKGAIADYITIRSAAPDALLPGPGIRITPAFAAQLPIIKSPNTLWAMRTDPAANHWKLMFLEFQANMGGYNEILSLGLGGSLQTQLSQVPYALIVDRVYVHGDPVMGQKRGIALHSRDTWVINSYVSECKAVGQDTQAISGFNGPGNYVIENNYLEAAAENFMLGGADPTIPNLVTTNVVFRGNYLRKPLAWRNPIIASPAAVSAAASPDGGGLAAGTYFYKVQARTAAGQLNKATSAASVEVSATIAADTTGAVVVSWTPVAGAEEYYVFGRTAGSQNMYWRTTDPFFVDGGAAGTSGTPIKATKWSVKNLFELKNAQDLTIEGNVFENLWVADQPGYAIVLTPRNQGGSAPWAVVQRVTFQRNIVRHTAGGVNVLGVDNNAPSQRTNNIVVRDNIFDDLTSATWGSGSRPFQLGAGPDVVTIDHNTIVTTDAAIFNLYGAPTTSARITNNMSVHSSYGIFGSNMSPGNSSIAAYLPASVVTANVLAGGLAKNYPAGNFFPTVAAWIAGFVDYAGADYHLNASSPFIAGGTDGADLGANVDAVLTQTANALSGDNSVPPGTARLQILPSTLPNGVLYQLYSQQISCTGARGACVLNVVAGTLPAGFTFDPSTSTIAGTPSAVETTNIVIEAYDSLLATNRTSVALTLTIDAPPFVMTMPAAGAAQVGVPYQLLPGLSGTLGSAVWTVSSGTLPAGLSLDGLTGVIAGIPTMWGTTTAVVTAQDSWAPNRTDSKPFTVTVAPAPIVIATTSLIAGTVRQPYQATLQASGGTGLTTWTIASGSLPDGLSLSDGAILGTPSAVGTSTFTVQAADAGWPGNVAAQTLALTVGVREVVLYASDASVIAGTWSLVADSAAAGGSRIWNPDRGAPKLLVPLASPANYFEMTFQAEAGVAYHLWLRGRADKNSWANDSVMIQFAGSVNAGGAPIYRIGTSSATAVNLEDCTNCGESGWGWQDNGWRANVMGPPIYFAQTGTQTLRVQIREDGFSIDQMVLSA